MGCSTVVGVVFLLMCLPGLCKAISAYLEQREAEKAKAEDERQRRRNPRAWKAKELVKLKRERLAAEKELAAERLRQENTRQNAGLIWRAGRMGGWW